MAKVLGFLIRYFSNYYTLHRSDLAAQAAPLDPRLEGCSQVNMQQKKRCSVFIRNVNKILFLLKTYISYN